LHGSVAQKKKRIFVLKNFSIEKKKERKKIIILLKRKNDFFGGFLSEKLKLSTKKLWLKIVNKKNY
jgi:hypothetical protein